MSGEERLDLLGEVGFVVDLALCDVALVEGFKRRSCEDGG